jgi:hypothetical protein
MQQELDGIGCYLCGPLLQKHACLPVKDACITTGGQVLHPVKE